MVPAEETETVAVIGAGPAGIAAAVQLQRSGHDPLVFEKGLPGGLVREANLVENYPGFPDGISGQALADRLARHLDRLGIRLIRKEVLRLDYTAGMFLIETDGENCRASAVIVATGTRPRAWDLPGIPAEARPRVVSGIFPLLELRGSSIAILGGGDAAFDYALRLSRENEVTIITRSARARSLPLLLERAGESPKIIWLAGTRIEAVAADRQGLALRCRTGEATRTLTVGYLLTAIGREPGLDFLSERLKHDQGELSASCRLQIVGDAAAGIFRQTAIAAGAGVKAAMELDRILREGDE